MSTKRRRLDSEASPAVTTAPLIDDDIDWTAPNDGSEPQSPDVIDSDVEALPAPQKSDPLLVMSHVTEGAAEGAEHADAVAQISQHQDLGPDEPGGDQGDPDRRQVQHAVAEYVRALLDPFYKAGIVDREVRVSERQCLHPTSVAASSVHLLGCGMNILGPFLLL